MAKIGLTNFRYGILTEGPDGTPTYAGVKKPGKAISCNVELSNNDAKLYAEDALAESDTSFQSGTITMGIDEDDSKTMAELLGHTISEDGQIIRNVNDAAPYVGLGRIVTKMFEGKYKYKVEFLYKVKFQEPSQENTTKGESIEFATTEIEGMVSALKNGNWSDTKTFDDKALAIAWLEGCLGRRYEIQYDLNGGAGDVPQGVEGLAGRVFELFDGNGLVGPEGRTRFLGWALSAAGQIIDQYIPMGSTILYAIWGEPEPENRN